MPAGKIIILMYHHVGPFAPPKRRSGLFCHVDRFRAQMRYLNRSGYEVIGLQHAYEAIFHGGSAPRRAAVITFDDGYRDFYEHAWPVLQANGLPATVFIVADRIGQDADWLQGPDAISTRLMDGRALRAVADSGISIGSHGATHCRLAGLDARRRRREIVDSKKRLEDTLGRPVDHLCYPYGSHDPAAREAARAAGYLTGLTTQRERADRARCPYRIPRQGIAYHDGHWRYAYKLGLRHSAAGRLAKRLFGG